MKENRIKEIIETNSVNSQKEEDLKYNINIRKGSISMGPSRPVISVWDDIQEVLYKSCLSPEQITIFETIIEEHIQLKEDVEELKKLIKEK